MTVHELRDKLADASGDARVYVDDGTDIIYDMEINIDDDGEVSIDIGDDI